MSAPKRIEPTEIAREPLIDGGDLPVLDPAQSISHPGGRIEPSIPEHIVEAHNLDEFEVVDLAATVRRSSVAKPGMPIVREDADVVALPALTEIVDESSKQVALSVPSPAEPGYEQERDAFDAAANADDEHEHRDVPALALGGEQAADAEAGADEDAQDVSDTVEGEALTMQAAIEGAEDLATALIDETDDIAQSPAPDRQRHDRAEKGEVYYIRAMATAGPNAAAVQPPSPDVESQHEHLDASPIRPEMEAARPPAAVEEIDVSVAVEKGDCRSSAEGLQHPDEMQDEDPADVVMSVQLDEQAPVDDDTESFEALPASEVFESVHSADSPCEGSDEADEPDAEMTDEAVTDDDAVAPQSTHGAHRAYVPWFAQVPPASEMAPGVSLAQDARGASDTASESGHNEESAEVERDDNALAADLPLIFEGDDASDGGRRGLGWMFRRSKADDNSPLEQPAAPTTEATGSDGGSRSPRKRVIAIGVAAAIAVSGLGGWLALHTSSTTEDELMRLAGAPALDVQSPPPPQAESSPVAPDLVGVPGEDELVEHLSLATASSWLPAEVDLTDVKDVMAAESPSAEDSVLAEADTAPATNGGTTNADARTSDLPPVPASPFNKAGVFPPIPSFHGQGAAPRTQPAPAKPASPPAAAPAQHRSATPSPAPTPAPTPRANPAREVQLAALPPETPSAGSEYDVRAVEIPQRSGPQSMPPTDNTSETVAARDVTAPPTKVETVRPVHVLKPDVIGLTAFAPDHIVIISRNRPVRFRAGDVLPGGETIVRLDAQSLTIVTDRSIVRILP